MADVKFLDNLSLGRRVRVARAAYELTQSELAAKATFHVREQGYSVKITPLDVRYVEKDWTIPPHRLRAILAVLGLSNDQIHLRVPRNCRNQSTEPRHYIIGD